MKDFPAWAKVMINIILFCVYLVFVSIVFSLVFPLVLQLFGQQPINPINPIYVKIQYFIAILVLLISLVFRKYFYISLKTPEEKVVVEKKESYTASKKKQVNSTKQAPKKKTAPKKVEKKENDEDIKIYVEKEIK